jgi:hypothetical protein
MSSIISTLKLTNAKRQANNSPVMQRRAKLLSKLREQIGLANAFVTGERYSVKKLKTVVDAETGERKTIEADKKMKQWWFVSDTGKLCINLRYGASIIELAKGKSGIEVNSKDELVAVLETVEKSVEAGELDEQIITAVNATKAKFKK